MSAKKGGEFIGAIIGAVIVLISFCCCGIIPT